MRSGVLTNKHEANRERTLLAAFLLSAWGPLAAGIAVLSGRSATQIADLIRRSVELLAVLTSWLVFRHIARHPSLSKGQQQKLERLAGLAVAATLGCSGIFMLALALSRFSRFQPTGKVWLGLAIAALGLVTNVWFWRKYSAQAREQYSAIIAAQRELYQAKSIADLCVLAALATVAANPTHVITRYVDASGSIAVSAYLLWSGIRAARAASRIGDRTSASPED